MSPGGFALSPVPRGGWRIRTARAQAVDSVDEDASCGASEEPGVFAVAAAVDTDGGGGATARGTR